MNEKSERYHRQIILPEMGQVAQQKLSDSSVLIVGIGGLGTPAALYLAAAGVGRIGLVDNDTVTLTNLHRQIIYTEHDSLKRKRKTEAAAERLLSLNSDICVETFPYAIDDTNAVKLIRGYDIVLDGTDSMQARYSVNRACIALQKPLIYAGVYRYEGQVAVFCHEHGPCLACLYPEQETEMASCNASGVLGVLPGTMGTLQATETLKMIIGIGEALSGTVLCYDALTQTFDKFKVKKRDDCPVCSGSAISQGDDNLAKKPDLNAKFISHEILRAVSPAKIEKYLLVDVRENHGNDPDFPEYLARYDKRCIPLSRLGTEYSSLPQAKTLVLICTRGISALAAAKIVADNFNTLVLQGGLSRPESLKCPDARKND